MENKVTKMELLKSIKKIFQVLASNDTLMIAITKLKKRATVGKYNGLNLSITPNSVQEKMLLEVQGELSMKDSKKAEKWCINIQISRAWHCISSFC